MSFPISHRNSCRSCSGLPSLHTYFLDMPPPAYLRFSPGGQEAVAHRSLFPGVPFAMGLGHSKGLETRQSGNTTRNWLSALLQHGLTRAHVAGHEPDLERRMQRAAPIKHLCPTDGPSSRPVGEQSCQEIPHALHSCQTDFVAPSKPLWDAVLLN